VVAKGKEDGSRDGYSIGEREDDKAVSLREKVPMDVSKKLKGLRGKAVALAGLAMEVIVCLDIGQVSAFLESERASTAFSQSPAHGGCASREVFVL